MCSSTGLMLQKGKYTSWSCINGWDKNSQGEESVARENKAAFLWGLPEAGTQPVLTTDTSEAPYGANPTHPTAERLCVGISWAKRRGQEPGPRDYPHCHHVGGRTKHRHPGFTTEPAKLAAKRMGMGSSYLKHEHFYGKSLRNT